MRLMLALLLAFASVAAAPPDEPAPVFVPLPTSPLEARLWADLDARLADPAAYRELVGGEAAIYDEGPLFPYALPVLALASRARAADADLAAIHARMAPMLDQLLAEAVRRLRVSSVEELPSVRGNATWLGQVALALGAWRLAGGDGRYEAVHGRLCASLLDEFQARGGAPLDAYPGLVWTFDTVPVLLALRVRDRTAGLPGADAAIEAHLRWLEAHMDPATGLPPARIDLDSGRVLEGPRGSDVGFRVLLMAQLDRARAQALYQRYTQHFAVDALGQSGFGEWPRGQTGRVDADSGPVVVGLGLSSTGFGLGAARVMGDAERFTRLDAQLQAWPRLWATMGPLVAPQVEALGMRLDTGRYATGLLVGDLSVLWGLSWADWGVGES